ncbi:MAG: IreB family regulatory phosphoprotein [Clostridia bacterium]|nr:IreB family regulatory phosphoprotein [Clostridia bacterium]
MLDPNKTIQFSIKNEYDEQMRQTLIEVYNALQEKGYNPISQIVGYILSEDPTYITTHNNARSLIRRLDRDELLQTLVKEYLTGGKKD